MLTSKFLKDIKIKSLRKRVWFITLDNLERGILSLAAQITDVVLSAVLEVELMKIINKLVDAMKNGFVKLMEGPCFKRTREISCVALKWGYSAARDWAFDLSFAKYLAMIRYNAVMGYNV
jgi:hypothetical protein